MATLVEKQLIGTEELLLESGDDQQHEIKDIWIHNLAAAATTFDLFLDKEIDGVLLRKMSHSIAPNDTLILSFHSTFTLDNHSKLLGTSSDTTDGLSITFLGEVVYRR